MSKHFNVAVEGDNGGLVICRGCKARGTYAALPSGECPTPYKPNSALLKESLAREQALQQRLTASDEQIDLLPPRHTEQPEGKRERFEKWVMATKHPVYGFLDGRSLARGDDRTGYADEYVQGLWVAYLAFGVEQPAPVAALPERLQQVLTFLDGAENLDGHWFGEPGPTGSRLWWRAELRKAIAETNLFEKQQ